MSRPARVFFPLTAAATLALSLSAAGCGPAERPTAVERVAELGGYGPAELADEAVARYLALGTGPRRPSRPAADEARGADPGDGRRPPSAALIAEETAARARRFNPDDAPAEVRAAVLAAVAADPRLDDAARADLTAALQTAFAAAAAE